MFGSDTLKPEIVCYSIEALKPNSILKTTKIQRDVKEQMLIIKQLLETTLSKDLRMSQMKHESDQILIISLIGNCS